MRTLIWLIVLSTAASAQVLTITAPGAGTPTLTGTTYTLASTCSSCPSLYSVEYLVNGQSQGAAFSQAGYELTWNTFNVANGTQSLTAVARDAANVTIATASAVPFIIGNTNNYVSGTGTNNVQIGVTPSCTSNCSGVVSFPVTASGSWLTAQGWNWSVFVDGDLVQESSVSASSPGTTLTFDTRSFPDATYNVKVTAVGNGGDFLGEWEQPISFQNGSSVPTTLIANYHEIFLTPSGGAGNCGGGSSCTLSATLYNADGSTVSSPTLVFYSQSTAVATVTSPGGAVTIAGGVALPNDTQIGIMASTASGAFSLTSSFNMLGTFQASYVGQIIQVTGQTSGTCNVGTFAVITQANTASASVSTTGPQLGVTGAHCTYATGPSNFVFAYANAANALPHFSRNGSILTSYSPYASLFQTSQFNQGAVEGQTIPFSGIGTGYYNLYNQVWNSDEVATTDCVPGAVGASFKVFSGNPKGSVNPGSCLTSTTSQTDWQTDITNFAANYQALGQTYGLYFHGIEDGLFGSDPALWNTTQGQMRAWNGLTYIQQTWGNVNTCTPSLSNKCYGSMIGSTREDEVNTTQPAIPLAGAIQFGINGLSQIVASSSLCTVSQTGWKDYYNAGWKFVISGATTSGFNSVSPAVYTITNLDANHFTFPCSVADGTYNAATDAALTIQQYAVAWHTGGYLSNYVTYDAFSSVQSAIDGATERPMGAYAPVSGSSVQSIANWFSTTLADFNEVYCTTNTTERYYSPVRSSSFFTPTDMNDNCLFYWIPSFQDGKPIVYGNAADTAAYYVFGGDNFAISSITNGFVTVTTPSTVSGATTVPPNVIPGVTRVQISGNSNGTFNGNFQVASSPTSNTVQIIAPIVVTGSATATLTFASHTYNSVPLSLNGTAGNIFFNDTGSLCGLAKQVGNTFTVSGSGTSWDNSGTYYIPYDNTPDTACSNNSLSIKFYLIPTGSGTGGTASIIANNLPTRGISIMGTQNGVRFSYAQHIYAAMLKAAASRSYPNGSDPQAYNYTTGAYGATATQFNSKYNDYNDFSGAAVQQGAFPLVNVGTSTDHWYALQLANGMINRMTKFLFQPSLPSPDFGAGFESTARSGSFGKLLLIQSFWNAGRSVTVDLSPFLLSGQPMLKYYCTYSGCILTVLNADTTSDMVAFDPVGTAWYVFPVNGAAEVIRPVVAMRLADVANATHIAAQCAYNPYYLDGTAVQDLGSGTAGLVTGTLNVDRNVGAIYCRFPYMDASNRVLASQSGTSYITIPGLYLSTRRNRWPLSIFSPSDCLPPADSRPRIRRC